MLFRTRAIFPRTESSLYRIFFVNCVERSIFCTIEYCKQLAGIILIFVTENEAAHPSVSVANNYTPLPLLWYYKMEIFFLIKSATQEVSVTLCFIANLIIFWGTCQGINFRRPTEDVRGTAFYSKRFVWLLQAKALLFKIETKIAFIFGDQAEFFPKRLFILNFLEFRRTVFISHISVWK